MRIDVTLPILRQTLLDALGDLVRRPDGFRPSVDPAAPVAPVPPAAALPMPSSSVAMLVAMAAVDPGPERRRRMAAATERGLGLLERIRDEMATGEASPAAVVELREWADGFAVPDDPVLAPIARDIELRVRVELARYDMRA